MGTVYCTILIFFHFVQLFLVYHYLLLNINSNLHPEYKVQEIVEGPESAFLHENMNQIFVEELHITSLGLLAVSI